MLANAVLVVALTAMTFVRTADGLDNGLALTPPMGWLAWQRFRCITDCKTYPDECIGEKLFMTAADLLVSEGYADSGYKYVVVDDCWMSANRTADGKLQADGDRFPSGIKALSDYVHSKGLKFGLYHDWGEKTCAGFPGVSGRGETDAKQFAEWGVDYVKLDGCYADVRDMDAGYAGFGQHLNNTGRPMVYSCSWPSYQEDKGMRINYGALTTYCNLWRNYGDIDDSWASVTEIADYFAVKQEFWAPYAGPGHWNDPDMLVIGNFGLTVDQSKAQMSLWAVLAAPLFMSNKLNAVSPEFKEILQNRDVIAVNQDPLGIQGFRVFRDRGIDIWTRPVEPVRGGSYSYAVAFVSRRSDGAPTPYQITIEHLGLTHHTGYTIMNLFNQKLAVNNTKNYYVTPESLLKVRVNPSGVVFLRFNVSMSVIKTEDELYDGTLKDTLAFV